MARAARIAGTAVAFVCTLGGALLGWLPLGPVALPFVVGFLLPLIAGYLLVTFLSYLLTLTLVLTGTNSPPSVGAQVGAAVYVIVCTGVLVSVVTALVAFTLVAPVGVLAGAVVMVLFFLPALFFVFLGYVLAAIFAPAAPFAPTAPTPSGGVDRPAECWFRGNLIGINAALNVVLTVGFFGPVAVAASLLLGVLPLVVLAVVALVLALATLLTSVVSAATVDPLPSGADVQNFVEAFAGWHSWLMPMSWPDCAVGWFLYYVSWIGHFLSLALPGVFTPGTFRILRVETITGNLVVSGGYPASLYPTGYNSGCFSFIAAARFASPAGAGTRQHETGHHLSEAAFGSFFGWIGAINAYRPLGGQGLNAYGERVAESNVDPPRGRPEVPVWR